MPRVTEIPVPPGEDYDHAHSTAAALASLDAAVESFDAVVDALLDAVSVRASRLDDLARRVDAARVRSAAFARAGEQGAPSTSRAAASLPAPPPREDDVVRAARRASNVAVRRAWRRDREADDGRARPSDSWLDRASGFDEGTLCRDAGRARAVPSMMHELRAANESGDDSDDEKEKEEVRERTSIARRLDDDDDDDDANPDLLDDAKEKEDVFAFANRLLFPSYSSERWDDVRDAVQNDGVGSVVRDDGSVSVVTSSVFSSVADRHRHRYHEPPRSFAGVVGDDRDDPLVAGARLHAATGSQPYLCELLHDSYGVGPRPPSDDPASYFPPPRAVGELFVRNTDGQRAHRAPTDDSAIRRAVVADVTKTTTTSERRTNPFEDENDDNDQDGGVATKTRTTIADDSTNPFADAFPGNGASPHFSRAASRRPVNPFELPSDLPLRDVAKVRLSTVDETI